MERVGKRWKDLPVKNATFDDLSEETFRIFREKAVKSGRLKAEEVEIDNETLLKNLGLFKQSSSIIIWKLERTKINGL